MINKGSKPLKISLARCVGCGLRKRPLLVSLAFVGSRDNARWAIFIQSIMPYVVGFVLVFGVRVTMFIKRTLANAANGVLNN